MSWPCKLVLKHFSAKLPEPAVQASDNICSKDCSCKCKCCLNQIQKYVNFDAVESKSGEGVQKMVRVKIREIMMLLRVAQSRENFWSNQYYKVDLLEDYKALGAAFEAPEGATNVEQLKQIMDNITSGYRSSVAQLSGTQALAPLKPTAAAPICKGSRCTCEDCGRMPWCKLQQLEAHQWMHNPSDNFHCRLCYRSYFIHDKLLSHLSRRMNRGEEGQLVENEAYKLLITVQQKREQAEREQNASLKLEELQVPMLERHHLDYINKAEARLRVPPAPRKRCALSACPHCAHSYRYSYSHQLHMQKKHGRKQCSRRWKCASCNRRFYTRRVYLKHLRRVRDKCRRRLRRFKCSRCKWRFQLLRSLKPHAKVHLRSYKCIICQLPSNSRCCDSHSREEAKIAFCAHWKKRRKELGRPPHRKRPVTTRPVCGTCQQEFDHAYMLDDHVRRVHLNRKDFICESCGMKFYTKKAVSQHVNKVHLRTYKVYCELCNLTIKNKGNYLRHCKTVRHIKQMAKMPGGKQLPLPEKPPKEPMFHCKTCDRHLTGSRAYAIHCKRDIHRRTLLEQSLNQDTLDKPLD